MLKNVFKKTYAVIDSKYRTSEKSETPNIPEGLWKKCNNCSQPIYGEDVRNNYDKCPKCNAYFRVHARNRIHMVLDEGTFEEWDKDMPFCNPLDFPGYEKKINNVREKTGLSEAIITGKGEISHNPVVIGVCDAGFIMSSMGYVVGEKITRAVERATEEKLPVVIFACSGGARMQEGIVSLMQMAKTSAALKRHHEAGQLYISVLTDPTTGGVTASFAMLGDIIVAEPNALIGFAGPRVIAQTIGQKLPEGFQRAEFLLEHGFIDKIVKREDMKSSLGRILQLHSSKATEEKDVCAPEDGEKEPDKEKMAVRSAWNTVQMSRSADRLIASDYINSIFDNFIEFHGDRYFADDGAVIGGIASFMGVPVTVIGQEKGKNTKDNIKRNFGMSSPEGYRKALRLMKQAETFGRPIICFIDTPGAFCGLEAEERGQGEAIAKNLFEMADLTVPILSIVIGEGGSGGALGLAVANEVWMMEHSVYSILSPEGFASILWKDSKRACDAARLMKITAPDLLDLSLIERIIPEDKPATPETMPVIALELKKAMENFFHTYSRMSRQEIAEHRYQRFRRM